MVGDYKDAVWALFTDEGMPPRGDGDLDPQRILVDEYTVQNNRTHLINQSKLKS